MTTSVEPPGAALRADFRHLIDGELVASPLSFEVINPATGAAFARCPDATREQGKPLGQARDEIGRAATQAEGMAQIEIRTDTLVDDAQRHIELGWFPLGVVGIITPWNAPINLATSPLTAALYTGNCVVLEPSPFTPLATLRLGELLAGVFPRGVVNVLAGGDAFGEWMTTHPRIDKISFTGSVATGKRVMANCAGTLKRVTLELGGNDAAIVLDDVDPQAVAPKLFFAAFVNSGQVCMAVKRIYAHAKIYDALCAALAAEARKAKLGDGLDAATQFGPIVPVLKFTDVDDAIARANDTRYGLAASVWSADPARARAIAQRLEVGTAWISQHRATAANVPFGGAKESGIGRHCSEIGLKSNMEARVVSPLRA